MIIRYSKYIPRKGDEGDRFQQLLKLFNTLLLQTNGDVDEALDWLNQLDGKYEFFDQGFTMQDFLDQLKEQGLINEEGGVLNLTNKGNLSIREQSLLEIFSSLKKAPGGYHETSFEGIGIERLSETKPFKFGDQPTNIDFTATISNALKRGDIENIDLKEEDFEVYETEHLASCATCLLIDISHSMILYGEDRITPAKQVAMALSELILRRFPKDQLQVIIFGDDAREISLYEIPFVTVGPYHTNTKAALRMARDILKKKKNFNKQIFMVTDGKPSAIFENGMIYKNPFGLDRKIVNKTLDEAIICRREKITISTFMLAHDPYLVNFVEDLTKANQGRAYYSGLDKLGQFIFVDYIKNRKKRLR